MKGDANGAPLPYHVAISVQVRNGIDALRVAAEEAGEYARFNEALALILRRLRHDPEDFGEPTFRYPNIQLPMYVGAIRPVVVHYGVQKAQRSVIV